MLVACVWALVTAWGAIVAGHPSYYAFYAAAVGIAAVSILRSVMRSARRRTALSALGAVGLMILAAAAYWLRPFPAEQIAIDAMERPDGYAVEATLTQITMMPDGGRSSVGLIFQPGARVDSRAYAAILSDIAAAGHPVIIVKQPLGIGLLALGSVGGVVEDRPETTWAAAGHSLGGVAASQAAGDGIAGLVLWASFPASDISDRTELTISSIYGTADAITVPDDIQSSRDRLPPQTQFIPLDGVIHSFFGDYGLQPGDGTPAIDRGEAQESVVGATLDLLRALDAGR